MHTTHWVRHVGTLFALLAAAAVAGCVPGRRIPLPSPETRSSEPPSIELNALVKDGFADKPSIEAPPSGAYEDVKVRIEDRFGFTCPFVSFSTSATHPVLGIRYLRMRLIRDGKIIQEVVQNQFPDSSGTISPTAGIIGTTVAGGSSPGVSALIQTWVARPLTVQIFALTYNFQSRTFEGRYTCDNWLKDARKVEGSGGGGGVPPPLGGGGTPQPPVQSVPADGAFAEIDATSRLNGQKLFSAKNGYEANISANTTSLYYPQQVTVKNATKSRTVAFAIGTIAPLPNPFGGFSFDENSVVGVVATFNPSGAGIAEQGTFLLVHLPGALGGTGLLPKMPVYMKDPANPSSTQIVEPRLFFSSDSLLALTLSAPVGGTGFYNIAAYDLRGGGAKLIGSKNVAAEFSSAKVQTGKIIVTLSSGSVEFTIP